MEEKKKTTGLLLAAVIITAFTLRAPVTGVGPLVDTLRAALDLSGTVAGSLTALPLLVFAAVSPWAGRLADRYGMGRTLAGAMGLILLGAAVRSWLGTPGLLAGMVLIGAGIACGNVLLPVVIKARWPDRIGPMTGVFTTSMTFFAGLASGLIVPLSRVDALGWQGALAVWCLPAAAAAVLWLGRRNETFTRPEQAAPAREIWRSRTAWYCTAYMGTQSILFYSFSTWLPAILAAKGVESAAAGAMASVYQLIGIAANFFAPFAAGQLKDQRLLTGGVGLAYLTGALLLWGGRAPGVLTAAVLLCGFCTGCAFSLCMALIGMRTRTPAGASALSGMLQTVGYAVAALGPVLVGRVLDASGSWNAPLLCLAAGVAVNGLAGQLAGRPGFAEKKTARPETGGAQS